MTFLEWPELLSMLLTSHQANPFGDLSPEATLLAILIVVLIDIAIIASIAVWIKNDATQRGENVGLWVTLWIVFSIFPAGLLGGLVVLIIYLVSRKPEKAFDRAGRPLLPSYPNALPGSEGPHAPSLGYRAPGQGYAPGWTPPNPPPYASGASLATSSPPTFAPPRPSKVKCPRCHTIFDYQKMPEGPTHVKCPSCGEEGNI